MKPVKRIEIIIEVPALPILLEMLREQGLTDYTVYHNLTGAGHRGERRNDEPAGGAGNACVLTTVLPADLTAFVEKIRPLLKRQGGVCLVSDAEWVIH